MSRADIGLIGLAVMGENLALNMAGKGFTVAVYNRTTDKIDRLLQGRGTRPATCGSLFFRGASRFSEKTSKSNADG